MAATSELTWLELSGNASAFSANLINQLYQGLNAYNKWQSFRAGRTNLEIATALSKDEADIAKMDSNYAVHKAAYDYMTNQTPIQSDYMFSLLQF